MNRNELQGLARLVIVAIAAFIAISQIAVVFYLPLLFLSDLREASLFQLIASVVSIAALFAAVWLLIGRSDRIAEWLIRPTEAETSGSQPQGAAFWLPAAFRIACLLGGFVFLYRLITRGVPMLFYLVGRSFGMSSEQYWRSEWHTFAVWLMMLAVGVYLLYGAPRFVRWHVKKTLELCGERPDNGPVE